VSTRRRRIARITIVTAALALAGQGAAAASEPPPANAPAGGIGFMGARLGMGLDQWKALAYPGHDPSQVAAACANGQGGTAPGTVVCTYAQRAGGVTLPLSFPLTKTWLVRDPTYDFVDGRLGKIAFHTSIDAFDDLSARFEARYGPASQIQRDDVTTRSGLDLPRVRKTWRLPGGSIEIIDPATPPTQLAVQFTGR
jgi:hypothetical protein